ncbi:MAG: hypothetical protein PHY34_02570 [Patescibacteria group bacterium]|nr:hypothetical protein [Patescibacteria group bacterium]MDD5715472.1 hypothetical protein [Patescibacteria group bacterium]
MKSLMLVRNSLPDANGSIRHWAGINLAWVAGTFFGPTQNVSYAAASGERSAVETAELYLGAAGFNHVPIVPNDMLDSPRRLVLPEFAEQLAMQAAHRGVTFDEILFEPETGLNAEIARYAQAAYSFLVGHVKSASDNEAVIAFSHAITIEAIVITALRTSCGVPLSRPYALDEIKGMLGYAEAYTVLFAGDNKPTRIIRPSTAELLALLPQLVKKPH